MQYHHALSRNATEQAIYYWKHRKWSNHWISPDVHQTLASQTFPAPDSMLFDPQTKRSVALEFKPPTESKRGFLTGLGQAIAYLESSSMAYLVVPSMSADGFNLSDYFSRLFAQSIVGKLPVGLIQYEDDEANDINMLIDIPHSFQHEIKTTPHFNVQRYWAKWVDMPIHALWIILDLAYQLPKTPGLNRIEIIWKQFFEHYLNPPEHRGTLEPNPTNIMKDNGQPLYILSKTRKSLMNKIQRGEIDKQEAFSILDRKGSPKTPGDTYYKSYKKNYLPFIKHLMLWDDEGHLTEDGFTLHKIGKIHQPSGATFRNHLAKLLLLNGKHLELILDVEQFTRNKGYNLEEALENLERDFIERGIFTPNRGRIASGTTKFLKYERILWGKLNLLNKEQRTQYVSERGFLFNWEHITKLCSLTS